MKNLKAAMEKVFPSDSYIASFIDFNLYNLSINYLSRDNFNLELSKKYPHIELTGDEWTHPVCVAFRALEDLIHDLASALTGFSHSSYILDDANIYVFSQYTNNPNEVLEKCNDESFSRHDYYDDVKDVFKQRLDGFTSIDIKKLNQFNELVKQLELINQTKIDIDLFESSLKNSQFISNLLKTHTTKYSG